MFPIFLWISCLGLYIGTVFYANEIQVILDVPKRRHLCVNTLHGFLISKEEKKYLLFLVWLLGPTSCQKLLFVQKGPSLSNLSTSVVSEMALRSLSSLQCHHFLGVQGGNSLLCILPPAITHLTIWPWGFSIIQERGQLTDFCWHLRDIWRIKE